MNRLQQLRADRDVHMTKLKAMIAPEADEFDQVAFDAEKAKVDGLNGQIEAHLQVAELEADMSQPVPPAAAGQVDETLRAASGARGPEAKKEWEAFGEFVAATAFAPNDQRLEFHAFENPEIRGEQRMDTGSAGGYAVPTQYRAGIMQVDPAVGPLLSRVFMLPPGTPPDGKLEFTALDQETPDAPDHQFGGVTMFWTGEGVALSETEAKLRPIELEPQELGGFITTTEKLLRNWPSSSAFIERQLRFARTAFIEKALHDGNGVKKPMGILNAAASLAISRNTASTVKYVDLVTMLGRLLKRGGSPFWLGNPSLTPELMQLKNDNNQLIWVDDDATQGAPGTLLGRPYFEDEFASAIGAKGDLMLVNPDPYYVGKKGSGPFVVAGQSGTNFETNKMKIKIVDNVDGSPWLTAPYKRRDGVTSSPFVLLDVPAS